MTLPEGHYEDLSNAEENKWAPFDSQEEAEEDFTELWDEIYPKVTFGGLSYRASEVLKTVDPVAFHEELLNHVDARSRD